MPWVPTTDFEEEVVNLQPHHDFIYPALSEQPYTYPRPQSHIEYAVSKKIEKKEQQKQKHGTNGRINGKLHVIEQVQRMAKTKPVGELPTIDDWETTSKIEQETVGMMRHYGMGISVDQPLNQKVTIATYPVQNTIKVVKNGRRKVPLFFDDNVFKLKEKVSDSSSGFESCNNSLTFPNENNQNDSISSDLENYYAEAASCNTSFVSTSSSLSSSFATPGDASDSFTSVSDFQTSSCSSKIKAQRLLQYDKLLEDTAFLSLDDTNSSSKQNYNSFSRSENISSWKPISDEDDDSILGKQESWPDLCGNFGSTVRTTSSKNAMNKSQSDTTDNISTTTSNSSSSVNPSNFLDRFIIKEPTDDLNTSITSDDTTTSEELSTYASITKKAKNPKPLLPKLKEKNSNSSNSLNVNTDFPLFYSTRRLYALKRNVK